MTAQRSRLFAAIALVAIAAALVLIPLTLNRYGLYILSRWAVLAIAAIGLNLTLGYAGQVSLAPPCRSPSCSASRSAGCSAIRRCGSSITTSPS